MFRFFKRLIILLFVLVIIGFAGAAGVLYWLVAVNPGPEIELANIEKILGRESPVFYRDGVEKIGVLFQEAHRQYLPYHQVPKAFINAIVAAEDDQFFDHFGIDILGITRAMIANIKAGRIVQGGSTITQQTAKNLFKRESRTIQAKLKELLYALRLEYHYPKEKILEFYVNQFFVSGNGHGLGVAARYYFDKEAGELTLLENAFIAGSVKRPNYYNPFTKASEEAAEKARKRAEERASYVLRNMQRLGFISSSEYAQARSSDIVFNRGMMSFSLNTVMDMVRDGLAAPEVTEALEEHGISNVSTSGIRIITTVDKELQDKTLYALRSELSRLDVRLRGYSREEVLRDYAEQDYSGDPVLEEGAFFFGRIESIENDEKGSPLLRVSIDRIRSEGVIDSRGLENILTALARYKRQRWSEAGKEDLAALLGELRQGDKVYVSVREVDLNGNPVLDLQRFAEVQGGALVLQKGAILAMAGGMENRFFNRAVDARRPMGSVFKPFLFAAALQLGWSATDLLNNYRDVFVYQDMPYFPRPDHISPHKQVSMSWAGVNSENLAAVWLLYNLTEQLTPPRLREVASSLDLVPRDGEMPETYDHFRRRIRDRYGITVNREALLQAAYDQAVKKLEADFLFDGRAEEYLQLKRLPYGLHFDRYTEELKLTPEEEAEISARENRELDLRREILGRNYLALKRVIESLEQFKLLMKIEQAPVQSLDPLAFLDSQSGNLKPTGRFFEDAAGRVVFAQTSPRDDWRHLSEAALRSRLEALDEASARMFWESVLVDGYLSVFALQQVTAQMAKESETLFAGDPYSMEILSTIRDYRVLVGLQYLIQMGREIGIGSELEPVLSFPLGSNVITLMDAVRLYETLVTGWNYSVHARQGHEEDDLTGEGLSVIGRIETEDGKEIYSRSSQGHKVLDTLTAATVSNILQNTVQHGTGRYARDHVRLTSSDPQRNTLLTQLDLPLPLLGKTGTANQFRNAAFLGYVPVIPPGETHMDLENGFTVGVYVGYDDNRPMEKGSTHVTGAVGALPTWSEIVTAIVNLDNNGDRLDMADLSFNGLPLKYPETGHVFVPVAPDQGGIVIPGRGALRTHFAPEAPSVLTYGKVSAGGNFEPERIFRPYWKNF